jgi:signal transduction histidine kinase
MEAESVAEGLELCRSQKIDAILLGYLLPDADGLEFLATFLARSSDPPPVVMMTGQVNESIAVRAMKAGAQDYLVKRDLTSELLQLTIGKTLENSRLKRQLQQCQERFQMSIDNMRECVGLYSVMHEFTIADDDPGIAPEQHDRVFRIFQAVNPQKRTDSTGIGLAIVKKIVEAEGGTIRLESQPGKGTTFYFTWPKCSPKLA